MMDQQSLAELATKASDPLVAPGAKASAVTATSVASAVVGTIAESVGNRWLLWLSLAGAALSLIYVLMQIIAVSPKTWGSIKWWFGAEKRRPDYLSDDGDRRRRCTDPREDHDDRA